MLILPGPEIGTGYAYLNVVYSNIWQWGEVAEMIVKCNKRYINIHFNGM
jgi:hypothetical protein